MKVFALFIILLFAGFVNAQKVTVDQSDVDAAVKSFRETVALRAALAASQSEADAWKKTAEAQEAAAKAKDDLLVIVTKQRDDALKMKCQKTKLIFGVISWQRCY